MAITRNATQLKGSMPVFWRGECKTLPGDFKLKQTFANGTLIPKGTPIKLDFATMSCDVCATALVVAGGTTAAPRVAKGHILQVGDTLYLGENNQKITAIDTSNADYDVLTLATALTGATAGAVLANTNLVPNAVVESNKEYDLTRGFNGVSAGYDVVVLRGAVQPIPETWLEGYCLVTNHSIKYIYQ